MNSKIKVVLVEDWQHFWKWSSVRFSAAFAALMLLSPQLMQMLADHWPDLAPFIAHLFPRQDQSLWPAIGAVLTILARITSIERRGPPQ
ncbi:hypothetical protein ACQUFY_10685 [Robbsia andropogonis]|uniref:DUF7940 domain-containing protein n=1 Tax=Robbsia andropogonis TaxID=28092 RepID=UPI003D24CAA5